TTNNHALVWSLIGLVEETENRKVLVGKGKSENSSGESKSKVFKRIAKKLIPQFSKGDKRIKSKWDSLRKLYQDQAKLLLQTGGGMDPNDESKETDKLPCYRVPVSGPDATTTPEARNI
ncbi:hypothetical protein JOM56_009701, partial [Amanita muscaria]